MLTQERLKEVLEYDPETGVFWNRFSRGRARAGCEAGSDAGHGYLRIAIDSVHYYVHHLAWFYVHGEWPNEIDHKDGNPSNNAISNLRLTDRTGNCYNSSRASGFSGLRGAYLNTRTNRWYSQIKTRERLIWLGTFGTAEEANAAYEAAAKLHHGEFYLHNRNTSDLGV